jgi:hypothetical protein
MLEVFFKKHLWDRKSIIDFVVDQMIPAIAG